MARSRSRLVRIAAVLAAAAAVAAPGCARRVDDARPLRLGYFPNATHAQALGFAPAGDPSAMVDPALLEEIARR